MTRPATWKEADMQRAIKVAREAGLRVAGIEIQRDRARLLIASDVDDSDERPDTPAPKEWPQG